MNDVLLANHKKQLEEKFTVSWIICRNQSAICFTTIVLRLVRKTIVRHEYCFCMS